MGSLKASRQGLVIIKQAIATKGWKRSSDYPLVEASKVLEPQQQWNELGPYAYGCSRQTWERFLQGIPIRDRSFGAFCQVLGIDPVDVVQPLNSLKEDWGEAPDIPIFHGRQQELATLKRWLVGDCCRLITIVGFAGIGKTSLVQGGIGKTDLSLHFARQIRGEFEYLIWRRLLNAPPPEVILSELIEFVSDNRETKLANTTDGLVTQLLKYLKQRRCLLILDNAESILQSGKSGGSYRSGYEGYGDFFQRVATSKHQSCLLLTSRVKPRDIEDLEGVRLVRSLELNGLDQTAARAIFDDVARSYNANFQGTEPDWSNLISFYSGNPLALEIVARHILRRFGGNLTQFLQHDLRVFGKIGDLLDWHFERLTAAEKTIMYWLALNREAVSITELKQDLLSTIEQKYLPETLDSLERQVPIEKTDTGFTLQPVLIEYMSEQAIAKAVRELQSGKIQLLNSHALIKASAKDYVKDSQIRLMLQPIINRTVENMGLAGNNSLKNCLSNLLSSLNRRITGYTAGNLINLMRYADIDLEGYDFSQLTIWQADLQNLNLHRVNFASCKFANCSLTQDFGGVLSIAFSPTEPDLFAIGDSLGGIRLFNLLDLQPYLYLMGHSQGAWITKVAYSPDGQLLASSSLDGTVRLWDTDTGECLQTFRSQEKWIFSVAYSPHGHTVASSGVDCTVRLWNVSTGECRVLQGHSAWIRSVIFHPNGSLVASASLDGTVRLWNIDTGECLEIINAHQSVTPSIEFDLNGEILAIGADTTIKLWEVKTSRYLNALTGHTKNIHSIAFNRTGTTIASGSFDRTVKLWNVSTGKCFKTLKGHIGTIDIVNFAPQKNILATGDNYGMLKLWGANTAECLKTLQGYTNCIWAIAISPDGQLLASGSFDEQVRLWDLKTGVPIATLTGHKNWVLSVAFSPNGQVVASSSEDETIKLWDVKTRKYQNILRQRQGGISTVVAFSPDGQLLVSGGRDGTLSFWRAATGEKLRSISAHSNWIWAIAFSPDGQVVASCSADRTIKLWDMKTGKCCFSICDPSSQAISVAFHPNSRMLFGCGEDRLIKLWDLATGEVLKTFTGHTDSIHGLLFISERKTIVSGSYDTTIRFWDLDTKQCIRVLEGHTSAIRGIALTPNRQTLASCSTDGTIRLWDLATGQTKKILRPQRPYEGMNITNVSGLTAAQKDVLIALGASERYYSNLLREG